jgi:hypothetical protein
MNNRARSLSCARACARTPCSHNTCGQTLLNDALKRAPAHCHDTLRLGWERQKEIPLSFEAHPVAKVRKPCPALTHTHASPERTHSPACVCVVCVCVFVYYNAFLGHGRSGALRGRCRWCPEAGTAQILKSPLYSEFT